MKNVLTLMIVIFLTGCVTAEEAPIKCRFQCFNDMAGTPFCYWRNVETHNMYLSKYACENDLTE